MNDTYEHDLEFVVDVLGHMKRAIQSVDAQEENPQAYIAGIVIELRNSMDYAIGTLTYEDEQWRFTPTDRSADTA